MMNVADIHPDLGMPRLRGFQDIMKDLREPELASEYCQRLYDYIKDFDDHLDQTEEAAMRLVSFGQTIQFAVQSIGYYNPKLICFCGQLEDGSPVQLIQNVNQISFLLLGVKRANPDEPKRPIGFAREEKAQQEVDQACDQSAAAKE